jgi:hypothetical protein
MAIDYMDLHILCGIGIYRHRDNQEIFLLLSGVRIMVKATGISFPSASAALRLGP